MVFFNDYMAYNYLISHDMSYSHLSTFIRVYPILSIRVKIVNNGFRISFHYLFNRNKVKRIYPIVRITNVYKNIKKFFNCH